MAPTPNAFVKKSIEKALQDLPSLPNVTEKVLRETESPDASAANVEKLISTDQSLASKVLRVVNSAYYGLPGQVSNLSQAIVILGMQQVRNMVLGVSAIGMMKAKTPRQIEQLRLFWLHSFGATAAATFFADAKKLSPKDKEIVFVAGLLHDIGKLFLFSNFTQTYDQVTGYAATKNVSEEEAESFLLGMNHAEIAAEMAQMWKLPENICQLLKSHEGDFGGSTDPVLYVLHLADYATKYLYSGTEAQFAPGYQQEAFDWLGFDEAKMTELFEHVATKVEDASTLFGMVSPAA